MIEVKNNGKTQLLVGRFGSEVGLEVNKIDSYGLTTSVRVGLKQKDVDVLITHLQNLRNSLDPV